MDHVEGVALITGGASGIGRQAAIDLAKRGASVAVADLQIEKAEETAHEIEAIGGRAIAVRLDIASKDSVENAFRLVEGWDDSIDILVNSAGILKVAPLLDYTYEDWSRVMDINVTGTFLCSQRAAKSMVRQKYGRIINISSISGARAGIGRVAYGTSKAAIIGLTRQFAMELGPYGITANAVGPGPILTPLTRKDYNEDTIEAYSRMIPAGHLGTPDDVAAAISFLASKAARYINGEFLAVDGGYLASGVSRTGNVARN